MNAQPLVSNHTTLVTTHIISEQEAAEIADQGVPSTVDFSIAQLVEMYVAEHLPHYLQELTELCAIDSGTYNKTGVDEVALSLAARMRDLGMDITIFENEQWGNDVYGVLRGTGKGIVVLLGHMDTVYPIGTAAARPVRVEEN